MASKLKKNNIIINNKLKGINLNKILINTHP